MEDLRLSHKHRCGRGVRLALAGVVAGVCALIASPGSVLAQNAINCSAQEAAIIVGSRIHILCNPPDGQIAFFALSVANPDVSRVLSIIETAVATRRTIVIQYNLNDLSGAAIGCAPQNCRLIEAALLQRQ
jgi:hypothetical protein